ncbi:MAG: hypothetical protein MHM6MM_000922 [Cercozoa sp. M6MM]
MEALARLQRLFLRGDPAGALKPPRDIDVVQQCDDDWRMSLLREAALVNVCPASKAIQCVAADQALMTEASYSASVQVCQLQDLQLFGHNEFASRRVCESAQRRMHSFTAWDLRQTLEKVGVLDAKSAKQHQCTKSLDGVTFVVRDHHNPWFILEQLWVLTQLTPLALQRVYANVAHIDRHSDNIDIFTGTNLVVLPRLQDGELAPSDQDDRGMHTSTQWIASLFDPRRVHVHSREQTWCMSNAVLLGDGGDSHLHNNRWRNAPSCFPFRSLREVFRVSASAMAAPESFETLLRSRVGRDTSLQALRSLPWRVRLVLQTRLDQPKRALPNYEQVLEVCPPYPTLPSISTPLSLSLYFYPSISTPLSLPLSQLAKLSFEAARFRAYRQRGCVEKDTADSGACGALNALSFDAVAVTFADVGDFAQQVALMRTTDVLVAVHGAGLALAGFLPSTSVTEASQSHIIEFGVGPSDGVNPPWRQEQHLGPQGELWRANARRIADSINARHHMLSYPHMPVESGEVPLHPLDDTLAHVFDDVLAVRLQQHMSLLQELSPDTTPFLEATEWTPSHGVQYRVQVDPIDDWKAASSAQSRLDSFGHRRGLLWWCVSLLLVAALLSLFLLPRVRRLLKQYHIGRRKDRRRSYEFEYRAIV